MFRALARLDDAVARVERAAVLAFLAVMSFTVFFDVLHRVSSTPEGLVLKLLCAATGRDRLDPTLRLAVPLIIGAVFYGLFWGALKNRAGSRLDTRAKLAAGAAGLLAAAVALVWLVLTVFPNGLVWSQPLALSLLLWVALLGATQATKARGHIVLEVADKIWPGPLKRVARFLSSFLAAAFAGTVAVLGTHYCHDFYTQWATDGVGYVPGIRFDLASDPGTFFLLRWFGKALYVFDFLGRQLGGPDNGAVALPRWIVYAAIPVTFTVMGLRFLGIAIQDLLGNTPETHGGLPGLSAPATEEVAS